MNRLAPLLCALLAACADAGQEARAAAPAPAAEARSSQPDNYAAFAAVLERHQSMAARVARISRALRVANAPLCSVTRLDAGLSTHRLADYPQSLQPLAEHFMALPQDGRFVRFVVPGSPADALDIRPGERIAAGWPIRDGEPLRLGLGEGAQDVVIDADTACAVPIFVVQSDVLNASTDGREIDLSSALVEQAGDDSGLAFIIAHEMAHVIRPPAVGVSRWDVELQADADALVLMRNAGFDVDGTVRSWAAGVELHRESQSLSLTHPPVDIRLASLRRALSDVQRRSSLLAAGEVLRLDEGRQSP